MFFFLVELSRGVFLGLCRHVVLPPDVAKLLPKNRLLSEVSGSL